MYKVSHDNSKSFGTMGLYSYEDSRFTLDTRNNCVLLGADPGFLERELIYIKMWGFSLLILSQFS